MPVSFDIDRLKSVKLSRRSRVIKSNRSDMMYKFRHEAIRALDTGQMNVGSDGRVNSPRFDILGWVDSFVALRIANMPKKRSDNKLMSRARHLIAQNVADDVWHGIELLESAFSLGIIASTDDIDAASSRYWEMKGLAA